MNMLRWKDSADGNIIYRQWIQGVQFINSDILCGLQIINRVVIATFVGGTLPYCLCFVYVALEPAS